MKRQSVINYPHRDLEAEKWAALYVRLSRDDDNEGDSNSIAHQIEILKKYAKDHNITRYKVYKDDGFSGKNFNRPGFQEMLSDIENGLVNTVIVKDISRFGRNYIEVGMYTESAFRSLTCGLSPPMTAWARITSRSPKTQFSWITAPGKIVVPLPMETLSPMNT